MLVTFHNVSVKYLDKIILNKVSFTINENDKIGIVGVNGVGKSTLLKAIYFNDVIDDGKIYKKNNLKIAYLEQEPSFDINKTILNEALRLAQVENEFEVKSMLSKFGLDEYDKKIQILSGGEKRRLALAIMLLQPCELLILDEPTNHLDIWMINWLEKYLIKWNKALLLVTHDRYFLERITKKTLDIEMGKLYLYDANYSSYLLLKEQRMESMIASSRKLKALLKKEAVWASLNPQARSTKSKERLLRFQALEQEVNQQNNTIGEIKREMAFSSKVSRLGNKTIHIENLTQVVDGKTLFSNFSYNVKRFDRLGVVGKNGSGKTTLFKTILQQLKPLKGTITIGETVKIGYLKQEDFEFDQNMKIIDYIRQFGEVVQTINGTITATHLLEEFLFSKNQQYMNIATLSGGEKRRLQLLSILITNPNILLLDEPTNDLDIYTLEILENYLETFKGAVIVISHDRYFLDKVVDHCFIYQDGNIKEYTGLISDYIKEASLVEKKNQSSKEHITKKIPRFTSSEKKEFDQIEDKIMDLESQIKTLNEQMFLWGSDYLKILSIEKEIQEKKNVLDYMYERYEYLNNINEQIEKYKKEKYYE
ncbi:MAG: ABC-F family ATP-binding cassette domain-containing protein [Staphylococcus sp.]|jgi:hypothetical protein|nr:ABC-F family ATP-binding cassette domain-containing protein [Staphylococcus sp.]